MVLLWEVFYRELTELPHGERGSGDREVGEKQNKG